MFIKSVGMGDHWQTIEVDKVEKMIK